MNYKLLASSVLSFFCINAYEAPCDGVFFAPYDWLYPVSIEARFDGIFAHRPQCNGIGRDVFNYKLNGYIQYGNGFFGKLGTEIVFMKISHIDWSGRCVFERVGIDLQFGKYWEGIGAVRGGLLSDGPGIGGDYWLVYKDCFKWLTTLEFSGNKIHGGYEYDRFRPQVKWLNRFFVWQNLYVSAGMYHLGDSKTFERPITQGFIGFGTSL